MTFITFEGIEGSGKSTLIAGLARRLEQSHANVLVVREPGGTEVGNAVRHVMLESDITMTALTEAFLMNASRAQLVSERIRPALAQGCVVLCDRYADSTIAYQGYGQGLDVPTLRLLCLAATSALEPDLTMLLDVPVSVSRVRLQERASADRFERQDEAFFERVRRGYLEMARGSARWHVLDATISEKDLLEEAWCVVRQLVEAPA